MTHLYVWPSCEHVTKFIFHQEDPYRPRGFTGKTFSKITQPAGANYLINTDYDFAVVASGNIAFFYGALTGGEGASSTFDVYRNFQLRDGLAAWTESATTQTAGRFPGTTTTVAGLKASTSENQTYHLSNVPSVNLYAVSGGNVIFGEAGKVYSWNATTQRLTLLLETAPTQVMAVGKTVYFVMGSTQVVYKISMD